MLLSNGDKLIVLGFLGRVLYCQVSESVVKHSEQLHWPAEPIVRVDICVRLASPLESPYPFVDMAICTERICETFQS